ncbi:MAG: LysM domain-containing protein [Chloroflexi bacterium]|nr:MAG: LysM domain-containing protein [Chloroflexota bacterium]
MVPAAGQVIHIVRTGENLFRIARCYGLTVEEVAAVNGISYPYTIYVGQRLIIPTTGPTRCFAGTDP